MINYIITFDLRRMHGHEGLILQGCGGDPQEWLDGINEMLTRREILLDGTKFSDISVFENEGLTCILFPFDSSVNLDIGKLAMWRLSTHNDFGGTWLSDYVENRLGGFMTEQSKPDCRLIGENGNIFNLMAIASRTLRNCGMADEAKEMRERIMSSDSYEEALCVIGDYVNITGEDDEEFDEDEDWDMEL